MRSANKWEVLSKLSEHDMRKLKLQPADLFKDAWTKFDLDGRGWVLQHFINEGDDAFEADEKARAVMDYLVGAVQAHAMSAFKRPIRVGSNGLRVPNEFVERALERSEGLGLL
jgi:hypothetical protein